ncbi:MAG: caspase family protein [Stigonema ocellatum SAG 48.90 = DSM 106950]|nr:caspase family protein [Stigonema ocellatum SAG 48.90 = DSM 106950]
MTKIARSFAITIGINKYINPLPVLETAVNDAKEVANVLAKKYQYEVLSLLDTDATQSQISGLLEDFKQQRLTLPNGDKVQIEPEDRVLFYFGGHGIAVDGLENADGPVGYLIPQDARDDKSTWLPMQQLHDALLKLPSRHLLIILDCCFAGSFRWAQSHRDPVRSQKMYKERYERLMSGCAQQVITSAADDEKALDSPYGFGYRRGEDEGEEHSPFAKLLLAGLNGEADLTKDGIITAHELYVYIECELGKITTKQTPGYCELRGQDKGEYVFVTRDFAQDPLEKAPQLNEKTNPYRGLESFNEEDKEFFFGRQRVIEKLHEHLSTREKPRLTVVQGASGTGKSSLVKAGLLPRLRSKQWQIIGPMRPGKSPFKALAREVLHTVNGNIVDYQNQINGLSKELLKLTPSAFIEKVSSGNNNSVLVIDQFEELVTMCHPEMQKQFLSWLKKLLAHNSERLHVIITLRSDFEPQFSSTLLERSQWMKARFVVPPMTQDELREVIEKPASENVMYFEPSGLVDDLINEVVQMPGALPLLSFTLSELYLKYLRRRDTKRVMTQEDYDDLGGVMGSLTKRATEEYENLVKKDSAYEKTVRRVMLRMVSVEGGESARRRVPRSELKYSDPEENSRVEKVIQCFSQARLIVEGTNSEGQPYVEPAHDALVRAWDKLQGWKNQELVKLLLRNELTIDVRKWYENQKQAVGILWDNDPRLPRIEQFFKSDPFWLNSMESEFVERSIHKKHNNLQRQIAGVITFILFVVVTAVVSYQAGLQAALVSHLGPVEFLG